jgi:glycosyltransferase involved in cell wall biosynthesis
MEKKAPKKKIFFCITKGNFGGAQRYVFDLATSLPADIFSTAVLHGEGEALPKKLHKKNIRTLKLETLIRNIRLGQDIKTLREIIRIFKTEKPDIIHLNSSKMGLLGGLAGRLTKVPRIIFTGHGWAFNEERNWFVRKGLLFLHWITILLSHETIAVSEKTKKDISSLPFIKDKITVIHNGVGPQKFLDGFTARQTLAPEIIANTWIGTISELHKNKGLDFAIHAFAKLSTEYKDSTFVIIGEGEERKNLETLISEYGLSKRIFLLGFIENAARYLKAFDVFTLTSRTEAFPYVLLEAGYAGLPIVASNVGGIPEIIDKEFLIEKGSVSMIEKTVEKILDNPITKKEVGERNKNHIQKKFSLSQTVQKTIALYLKPTYTKLEAVQASQAPAQAPSQQTKL